MTSRREKSDRIGRLEALLERIRQRSAEPRPQPAMLLEEAEAWADAPAEIHGPANGVAPGNGVSYWAGEATETQVAAYQASQVEQDDRVERENVAPPVSAEMEPLPLSAEASSPPQPPSEPFHEEHDSFQASMLEEYEMSEDVVEIHVDADDDSVRTSVQAPGFELPPVEGLPTAASDLEATMNAAEAAAALDVGTTTAVQPVASIAAIAAERALGAGRPLDVEGTLEFERAPVAEVEEEVFGDQGAEPAPPAESVRTIVSVRPVEETGEIAVPVESVRTIVSVRPVAHAGAPEAPSVSGSRLTGEGEALLAEGAEGDEMIVGEADLVQEEREGRTEDVTVDVDDMIEPPASSRRPITLSAEVPIPAREELLAGPIEGPQAHEEESPPVTPPPASGRQIAAEYNFEPAPPTLHPLPSLDASPASSVSSAASASSAPSAPSAPSPLVAQVVAQEEPEAAELDAPRQIWKAVSSPPQVEPETFGLWLDDTLSL